MTDNKIAQRVLQVVIDGGPCRREYLEDFARRQGSRHPIAIVAGMIEDGSLVKFGASRGTGARWGAPGHPGLARPPKRIGRQVISGG